MGSVDLVVVSAGVGYINPELAVSKELDTVATNVAGFTAVANVAFHHFVGRGTGHLVGISSVAGIRGSADAPAYNASKAFVSNYLEGLRQKAVRAGLAITVTDVRPGFVDTDMAKGEGRFWVAPPAKAAAQIYRAIELKRPHAYITKRWRVVGWLLRMMPGFIYSKI
jgi:short-subunit dehydrogenase